MKPILRAFWLLSACLFGLYSFAADSEKAITVFAAASLTNALQDLGDAFTKDWHAKSKMVRAPTCFFRPISSGWITCKPET